MTDGPLTLSQFALAVGDSIRRNPALQAQWVVAELSDVRVAGGHCYMELIEKDQRGATVAKMRAMIWQSVFPAIRRRFFEATGSDIVSGLKVMVLGTATYHSVYGLSLNITGINPEYTLGDMERLRREILERLTREGVAGDNRQYVLPPDTQRIAVISAEGAAGYGDFMKQLDGNTFGFRFYTHLFPAVMQGTRTSESVRAALDAVEATQRLWDCVTIVRGGGSTSDLNGFDDYELALRVATFPLPVLVGIGHERDRTVLDEIANTRLKTPTAVGAFLVERLAQALKAAESLARQAAGYATERVKGDRLLLSHLESSVPTHARSRLAEARLRLSRLGSTVPAMASGRIARAIAMLDSVPGILANASSSRLRTEAERINRGEQTVAEAAARQTKDAAERLSSLGALVDALNPAATLRRGYSITRLDGKAVRDASSLSPGQEITTTLASGTVTSTVK